MVPCCFQVNSELKLLLSAFTHKKKMKKKYQTIFTRQHYSTILKLLFGDFGRHKLKLEEVGPTFSILNRCPSLPFVATDDRKQFESLNMF